MLAPRPLYLDEEHTTKRSVFEPEAVYPQASSSSSDETGDEDQFQALSTARSMSSLATTVESDEHLPMPGRNASVDEYHQANKRFYNAAARNGSFSTLEPKAYAKGEYSNEYAKDENSKKEDQAGERPARRDDNDKLYPENDKLNPENNNCKSHSNTQSLQSFDFSVEDAPRRNGASSSPGQSPQNVDGGDYFTDRDDERTPQPVESRASCSTLTVEPSIARPTSQEIVNGPVRPPIQSQTSREFVNGPVRPETKPETNGITAPSSIEVNSSKSSASLVPRSSSTSAIPRKTMPPPQPQKSASDAYQNVYLHLQQAGNRSSMSSQRSGSSSHRNSLHRVSTASAVLSSRRTSFSFSRRRSLLGQRLPSSSAQLDEQSPSAHDIERLREAIIAQREHRRRKREFLEDERVLVGTKVSEGHVNFVTAYNMLTGIRVSVSRCNAKVNHELCDADFTAKHKLAFDISGNELTPSAKYDFKFKDYAPWVFRHLREMFKLDPADYLVSLTSKYIVSELGSPGKSGSFFYFSRDYRFIIKTIHHSEHKMLRKILKDYYLHVKNNPNTLISQFYGLHRVKLPFGRKIHFIVMNNLFPPHRDIHRTYDLKGSTLGRMFPEPADGVLQRSRVYKDLNWIKHNEKIRLGPRKRAEFIGQLEIDVALLKRLNIMDYSLLIGIHDLTKGNTENIRDSTLSVFDPDAAGMSKTKVAELRKAINAASPTALSGIDFAFDDYLKRDFTFYADSGGFRATDENNEDISEIYYLGVIDCLTPYTFFKRIETFWKGLSHSRPTISAVPAQEYGDRFLKFIKAAVTGGDRVGRNNDEEPQSPRSLSEPRPPGDPRPPSEQMIERSPVVTTGAHLPALPEASSEAVNDNNNNNDQPSNEGLRRR
ncbi:phosphatidylinositol 4-phosphate 5-kinase Mss4p [Trichomonascus vanleenenianus]|uniref:1-phosphatidylinositol-4-phosphate 5-kinase n=1 Tax=Trichomonascus vanleenenianus TaxID=2268995 RepID=UPI003ECA5129